MKKLTTLFLIVFLASCNNDIVEGPAMSFYPTSVQEALEEDGIPYQVSLEATGELIQGGVVKIEFTNHEFIKTVPAHENGVLLVQVGSAGSATFSVEALDDDLPNDYISNFRITDTGGDITGIADSEFNFIVRDDDLAVLFGEDFESGNLDDWEIENVGSGNDWRIGDFSGNTYADISNFQATGLTESWLLSPEIDFDAGTGEVLSFQSQTRFNDQEELFEAVIVTGYTPGSNPGNATITPLTYSLDPHEGGGFGDFTDSGEINLEGQTGVGRIAFHFRAASESDGSGWSVDNVEIVSFDPDNSDGIPNDDDSGDDDDDDGGDDGGDCTASGNVISLPFTDDFESCATEGQFNIPSNWIEEIVPGSKEDRGWGCRDFGRNGWGARASAFGGDDGTDDAWLISDGVFDLTSVSSASLVFWIEERFSGPGTLTVQWSTDYEGCGDPTSATWTELTDANSQISSVTAETWTEVTTSLSGAAGEEIYLAFRYAGGTASSSIAYTLDDLSITGN